MIRNATYKKFAYLNFNSYFMKLLWVISISFCCFKSLAQQIPVKQKNNDSTYQNSVPALTRPPTTLGQDLSAKTTSLKDSVPMTSYEFGLSLGVLLFGVLLIILEVFIIKFKNISDELVIRFILVTLIITATLFLITAGYSNDQIAPAIGLFGTVAGYILGKASNKNDKNEEGNS